MYADFENSKYVYGIVLSHCDNYVIFCLPFLIGYNAPLYGFPVHGKRLYTLFHVVGIHHFDVVGAFAEFAG